MSRPNPGVSPSASQKQARPCKEAAGFPGSARDAGAPRLPALRPECQADGLPAFAVLYEDPFITVCIKPSGISSEDLPFSSIAAEGERRTSLAAGQGKNAAAAGGHALTVSMPALLRARWGAPDAYVGVIHRLDAGVSGIMVYARTPKAAAALSAQIQARSFEKEYRCVCLGVPEPAAGEMTDFLFRDGRKGKVFPVGSARKGAKQARLDYQVLSSAPLPRNGGAAAVRTGPFPPAASGVSCPLSADTAAGGGSAPLFEGTQPAGGPAADPEATDTGSSFRDPAGGRALAASEPGFGGFPAPATISLCRVRLHTGRTHQIRVQFASRKHPLLGDGKYGSRVKCPIALQSARIAFAHPKTGKRMEFSIPLPAGWPWELFCPEGGTG